MRAQMSKTTFNPFFLFNEKIPSQVRRLLYKKKKNSNNFKNIFVHRGLTPYKRVELSTL